MSARPRGARFGKPDVTGRSSGKRTGRLKKLKGPPKDQPWCWLSRELITSAAWRARSINTIRLIDALLVDHMNHAGTENGNLMATYDQQVTWGASRPCLKDSIDEATFLGLIRVDPGGRWAGTNEPSRYRLTWLYDDRNDALPTSQWKGVTEEDIKKWRDERRQRAEKKQIRSATSCTTVVQLLALPNRKRRKADTQKPHKTSAFQKRP